MAIHNGKILKITLAQLDPVIGDIDYNLALLRQAHREAIKQGSDLLVCPELFLGGYTGSDILKNPDFCKKISKNIKTLISESTQCPVAILLGTVLCESSQNGFLLIDQGNIIAIGGKYHLANDSVFEEKRNFLKTNPHTSKNSFLFRGVHLGVLLCNDLWFREPVDHLVDEGAEIIIAINASPFSPNKHQQRKHIVAQHVKRTGKNFVYLNQVGGQDSVVFDGGSFVMNGDHAIALQMAFFESGTAEAVFKKRTKGWVCKKMAKAVLPDTHYLLYAGAVTALLGYMHKNSFSSLAIGLSGGIDSALCAAMAVDAVGASCLSAYMMPSVFTSQASLDDAQILADNLGIKLKSISIMPAMQAVSQSLNDVLEEDLGSDDDIAFENMQARLRGLFLMTIANRENHLLLATGNKSEFSTGYSTLYGDLCGGFAPLGDLYKKDIYALSHWRNAHRINNAKGPSGAVIPSGILQKVPSAELRPNQKDQDSLPPYDVLDQILHGLIEENLSQQNIVDRGFDQDIVQKISLMLERSEYKRRQAPPIVKLSSRCLTTERRYPLTSRLYSTLKKG